MPRRRRCRCPSVARNSRAPTGVRQQVLDCHLGSDIHTRCRWQALHVAPWQEAADRSVDLQLPALEEDPDECGGHDLAHAGRVKRLILVAEGELHPRRLDEHLRLRQVSPASGDPLEVTAEFVRALPGHGVLLCRIS